MTTAIWSNLEPSDSEEITRARYRDFLAQRYPELRADDNLLTAACEAIWNRSAMLRLEHWVASHGEQIVGTAMFTAPGSGSPEGGHQPITTAADVFVAPWSRRVGVARRLLPHLLDVMNQRQSNVLTTRTDDPDGHGCLKRWGFTPGLLDQSPGCLDRLDDSLVRRWISEGRDRSPRHRLTIHDGGLPEDALNACSHASDTWDDPVTVEDLRAGVGQSRRDGLVDCTAVVWDSDGLVVAATRLVSLLDVGLVQVHHPHGLAQCWSGVSPFVPVDTGSPNG